MRTQQLVQSRENGRILFSFNGCMGFIFVANTYFEAEESLWSNKVFSKEGTDSLGGQPCHPIVSRLFHYWDLSDHTGDVSPWYTSPVFGGYSYKG